MHFLGCFFEKIIIALSISLSSGGKESEFQHNLLSLVSTSPQFTLCCVGWKVFSLLCVAIPIETCVGLYFVVISLFQMQSMLNAELCICNISNLK